jgi:hypothetical protein
VFELAELGPEYPSEISYTGRTPTYCDDGTLSTYIYRCSVTGLKELEVRDNFDSTTSNLGGDTEGLEERGLTVHTGVTAGTQTSSGAMAPARAGAATRLARSWP